MRALHKAYVSPRLCPPWSSPVHENCHMVAMQSPPLPAARRLPRLSRLRCWKYAGGIECEFDDAPPKKRGPKGVSTRGRIG
jgi:hypothetical protein